MNVCNQLFRAVSDVSMQKLVPDSGIKAGELVLRYEVTGSCRGCPEPLLFEDSINCDATSSRVLLDTASSSRLVFKEERELQTTTCTCVTGVVRRGVVQSKFIDGFNEWIEERKDEGELTNLTKYWAWPKAGRLRLDLKPCPTVLWQVSTVLFRNLRCIHLQPWWLSGGYSRHGPLIWRADVHSGCLPWWFCSRSSIFVLQATNSTLVNGETKNCNYMLQYHCIKQGIVDNVWVLAFPVIKLQFKPV